VLPGTAGGKSAYQSESLDSEATGREMNAHVAAFHEGHTAAA
jgi:hypothetical protein